MTENISSTFSFETQNTEPQAPDLKATEAPVTTKETPPPADLKKVAEEVDPKVKEEGEKKDGDNLLDKKFKVKINGVEEEKELKEIIKDYQKFQAADRRFQEAAELKKAVEQQKEELAATQKSHESLVNYLIDVKNSPEKLWELGSELGVNIDELAHEYVLKKMEYSMLDPREKEILDQRKQLEKERRELEEFKARQQSAKQQAEYSSAQKQVEDEMLAYFAENNIAKPDLPVLTQAVNFMLGAMDSGRQLTFAQAYKQAQNQIYPDELKERLLEQAIREGRLTEEQKRILRQADIKAAPQKTAQSKTPPRSQSGQFTSAPTPAAGSIDDWFGQMDKVYGSKRR